MDSKLTIFALVLLCALEASSSSLLSNTVKQQSNLMTANNNQLPVSVQTTSGTLNGSKQTLGNLGNNISVYKFLSVPYAEAPINQLRFQRPVEIQGDRSNIEVDASKFGKTCPQFRHLTRFISPLLNIDNDHQTSEDCLHLNVFVPSTVGQIDSNNRLEPNKQLPVIVWIPGEGFDFADARQFDGSILAQKTQSIVITVQYRVGVLGFLHAPQLGIKGNMGIHDQVMALKWIKKNVAAFGGDSDRVTVMGRFSGSMSISAMITAPKQDLLKIDGRPLFNRVALLSGVAVDNWIIDSDQHERVNKIEESAFAKDICTSAQITDGSCLQSIPVDQLLPLAGYGWRLVVDDELIGQTEPIEAVSSNQFASHLDGVLIGETGMEGTLCLYRHMLNTQNSNYAKLIEEDRLSRNDVYDVIKDDSITYFKYNMTAKQNPIQAALETMIEDKASGDSGLRDKYLNACSSYMVKSHSERFKRNILARNQLDVNRMNPNKKSVEVYHYELKYKPSFSLAPDYIKTAAHGDDIPLIFGLVYNQPRSDVNVSDLLMSRKMMSYIGNFVHGNNPLLGQQASGDNESTSMDENDTPVQDSAISSYIKRSWSSESQIHPIEFNESDQVEVRRIRSLAKANGSSSVGPDGNRQQQQQQQQSKGLLRLLVISRPQWFNNQGQELPPLVDLAGEQSQQQYTDEPVISLTQYSAEKSSQRFHDVQRYQYLQQQQQLLEENGPWFQANSLRRSQTNLMQSAAHRVQLASLQQPTQQQTMMSLIHESSFVTMILLSSCIMVFAIMSLCLGLCVMVFRNSLNIVNAKSQKQQFASSSSSCNICDESQGAGIDAVLVGGSKKENRGFCNVFAKLRSPNHHNAVISSQCAASTATPAASQHRNQAQNTTSGLVLHSRTNDSSNGVNATSQVQ